MSKGNYRFVYVDYSKLNKFAADFVQIYNEAWAFHDDFEPLTPEALKKRLKEIKPAMPKEFAVFAYDNDRPIGFFIAILEINQVFKRFKGKMGLWQQLQFLLYRSSINKAKGIVFGVVPDYHNLGIETGLIMKCYDGIKDDKIVKSMELAWIGDFNPKMISMLESLGAKKTKIHHTYRKEISENILFFRIEAYFCTSFYRKRKGNDSVAQLVEQYTFNVWVLGSSPSGITRKVN